MTVFPQLSFLVIGITSVTLAWVAVTDLRQFKIRNELVLVLAGLYFVYALVSGRWVTMHWNLGFAALVLICLAYAYSQEQIGGGDMKLLTVAFLWTGPFWAVPFVLLLVVFIGVHYVAAKLKWVAVDRSALGERIPLAPSVAAGLIATFALGGMAPLIG
jgi:prepilin peptidase CpaA